MFLASVNEFVELFWERAEYEAEFMESQLLILSRIETDHVVKLHSIYATVIWNISRGNESFAAVVNQLEQVYQVEVVRLR